MYLNLEFPFTSVISESCKVASLTVCVCTGMLDITF